MFIFLCQIAVPDWKRCRNDRKSSSWITSAYNKRSNTWEKSIMRYIARYFISQWKPLLKADTLGTFSILIESFRFVKFLTIVQCLWSIKSQRFPCTVVKFQVVNEAIQTSSSLAFIANFDLFLMMRFPYSNDNTTRTFTCNRLFQWRNPTPQGGDF